MKIKIKKEERCKACGTVTAEEKEITYGIEEDTELVAEFVDKDLRDKCFNESFEDKNAYKVEVETGVKSGFKVICLR